MIIVDASIAIKWLNYGEEGRDAALALYEKHLQKEETISVPHFLFIEVSNVLATKPYYTKENIRKGLDLLFTADFLIYQIAKEDIFDAAAEAKKYGTSVYDMLYAVIAKKNNCFLVTADTKFAAKVQFPFVKTIEEI